MPRLRMRKLLECERHKGADVVEVVQHAAEIAIVLKLQSDPIAPIVPDPQRRAVHASGVAQDGVEGICVEVLVGDVGTPRSPLPSDLRVEPRHVERPPGAVKTVVNENNFAEKLELGSEVDNVGSRNHLLNAGSKVWNEMVVVDGKTGLQAWRPVRTRIDSEVDRLPFVLIEFVLHC